MENRRVLIDTSIVIEYLRSSERQKSNFIKLYKDNELIISVISVFELFNGATTEKKKQDIENICNEIETLDFDIETAKMASEIYRQLRLK